MEDIQNLGRRRGDPGVAGSNGDPLGYLLMGHGEEGGLRARSTTVTNDDGSVHRIINIGVPSNHPMAAPQPNGPNGLHNMRLGPMPLPVPPTFIIRLRRPRDGNDFSGNTLNTNGAGPRVNIAPHREPTDEELSRIDDHVGRITEALNVMIARFSELYVGQQLMRIARVVNRDEF